MSWRLSDFTEIGRLGAGATGRVVSARHDDTGTVVAIKYLSDQLRATPGFIERFRGEARLLVDVDSPHIARLYEYVETESGAAIVMELVDGLSLYEMIRQCGPTDPEAALYVLKGSLLGLAAAHQVGVVHRDYKPENVLVDGSGTSKLVDFGIAVRAGQQAPAPGTPLYMAPEQWSGAPASPRTDVYAATATFFECLTTRPPFQGEGGLPGLRRAHETLQIPIAAVPPEVRDLISRGMAKDPRARPVDAAAFLLELERIAVAGYGIDWEKVGKAKLVRAIAPLLLLLGAGEAGKGVSHAVTSFLGGPLATRILAGTALAVALVVGVGAVISGPTNAAAVTALPEPTFVATFPSGGSSPPALAPSPSTPGAGTTTPTGAPTSVGTTALPGTTHHHAPPPEDPPPPTHPATHPVTTPPKTPPRTPPKSPPKTSPTPSPSQSSSPPPPPPTVVNDITIDQFTQNPVGAPFNVTWTVTVDTSGTGPVTLTVTFSDDAGTPPVAKTFQLSGHTSYSEQDLATFDDNGVCAAGGQVTIGIQAVTTPDAPSAATATLTGDCGTPATG